MNTLSGLQTSPILASRVIPGLLALVVGCGLFFLTGFAAPSFLHNATHDARHALGLPCH